MKHGGTDKLLKFSKLVAVAEVGVAECAGLLAGRQVQCGPHLDGALVELKLDGVRQLLLFLLLTLLPGRPLNHGTQLSLLLFHAFDFFGKPIGGVASGALVASVRVAPKVILPKHDLKIQSHHRHQPRTKIINSWQPAALLVLFHGLQLLHLLVQGLVVQVVVVPLGYLLGFVLVAKLDHLWIL